MIENLSVSGHQPSPVSLRLSEDFLNGLSDQEVDALKARGLCYIDLQELEEPLILGRDTFRSVFGEKIRGAETVMLSRRHCVFRISLATSSGETKRAEIKVEIENTSTNGVEVNDRILAHGERHVLSRGDVITLLRIPHVSPTALWIELLLLTLSIQNRDGHLQYGFGLPPNDFPESSQATIPDHDFANIETDRLSSQQNNCGEASCVDSGHSMGGDETQPVRIRVVSYSRFLNWHNSLTPSNRV
ncbi:TPA: hypothetical protein N0F65_000026 [Lagenidium giganteum]|uniref:FHA domain-containing protein n=1 Tax=Lagenidium giganteum TaxID=4803 RepID=A0AAV2YPB1_9STRA|nr:TPA: hypothetical protein N0F65_000026 [Lagenidium giganteum]